MKINHTIYSFRHLLILPLLAFILAVNPCGGAQVIVYDQQTQEIIRAEVNATSDDFSSLILINETDTPIDLTVRVQEEETQGWVDVDQITLNPNEERNYSVPGLMRNTVYDVEFVSDGEVAGRINNLNTNFKVVYSSKTPYPCWGFAFAGNGPEVAFGGYYDQGLPNAQGFLYSGAEPVPDFDVTLFTGGQSNRDPLPHILNDSFLLIGDPTVLNPAGGGMAEAGALYIFNQPLPTSDFNLDNADVIRMGDYKLLRLGAGADYDATSGYVIASADGYVEAAGNCNNQPKCGACYVFDAKNNFAFVGRIKNLLGQNNDKVCRNVKFLRNGDKLGILYLRSNDYLHNNTECRVLNYNLDSPIDDANDKLLFAEPPGSCGRGGPLTIEIKDLNGDGLDDLYINRLILPNSWETRIYYTLSQLDPGNFVTLSGTGEIGGILNYIDFNNDGNGDLVVTTYNYLLIYLNADLNSNPYRIAITPGVAGYPHDFDGNGYPDFLGVNPNIIDVCYPFIMY